MNNKKKYFIQCLIIALLIVFIFTFGLFFNFPRENKVNVKDYLSNKFNDQPGIQKAIEYAEKKHIPIVYFPKGKYIVNSPILVDSNITLKLHKNAIIYRNFSGTGSKNATIRNRNQRINGNYNIKIEGGTIKASTKKNVGKQLAFWGVNNLKLRNIKFRGTYGDWTTLFRNTNNVNINKIDINTQTDQLYTDGIHIVGGSNININDSKVTTGDDAIAFTIENKHDSNITNVNVSNCNLTTHRSSVIKIITTKQSKGTISNIKLNNITGIGGTVGAGQAIFLEDESNSKRIKNISFDKVNIDAINGAGYGGQIKSIYNISLKNSTISNSEGTGIVIQNTKKVILSSLKIINPRSMHSNGISIENTSDIIMNNVILRNPKLYGILINRNTKNVNISNLKVDGINKADVSVYTNFGLYEYKKITNFFY